MISVPPSTTLFPYTTLFRSSTSRAPRGQRRLCCPPWRGSFRLCLLQGAVAGDEPSTRPAGLAGKAEADPRVGEHTAELPVITHLVCRLLREKKKEDNEHKR